MLKMAIDIANTTQARNFIHGLNFTVALFPVLRLRLNIIHYNSLLSKSFNQKWKFKLFTYKTTYFLLSDGLE